jgi:uncharacterized protein (TIGR02453 family)
LTFLRSLKRNNDREWFRARRDRYDADVREPMIAVIERLAIDFRTFAPEFVAEPRVSLYRIYRDTRFSADKRPLKTHVAAHFPMRGIPKGEGGGLYFELAPGWVWMGGGLYRPSAPQLRAVRRHIAESHPRLHRLVTAPAFRKTVGTLEGERLTRPPRGFSGDHPATHYLMFKQFLAGRELEPEFALTRTFYRELIATFRAVAPVVQFLNDGLQRHLTPAPAVAPAAPPRHPPRDAPPRPVPAPMW